MHWLDFLLPSSECTLCRRPIRPGAPWACTACLKRLPRVVPPACDACGRPLRTPQALDFEGESAENKLREAAGGDGGVLPSASSRGEANATAVVSFGTRAGRWRFDRLRPRRRRSRGRQGGAEGASLRCRFCIRRPPFSGALHLGPYEGALRMSIQQLKFEARREIARTLGALLAEQMGRARGWARRNRLIVPVPLHARRLAERGYNQAELLATAVGEHLGWRVVPALHRLRPTRSQVGLSIRDRRENLAGAFGVTQPTAVAGRDLLLIDDVYTTGVTAHEATLALLRNGAASVAVACVAVTVAPADLGGEV